MKVKVFILIFTGLLANSLKSIDLPIYGTKGLKSFSVECRNFYAEIQWTITEENKSSFFTIQRTTDGVHFEIVSMIQNMSQEGVLDYKIIDQNPITGISYYRISETDASGNVTFLNTIVYTPCENADALKVSYEEKKLNLEINKLAQGSNPCTIVVENNKKEEVFHQSKKISTGLNILKLDAKLPEGTYVVLIQFADSKTISREFVIEKH